MRLNFTIGSCDSKQKDALTHSIVKAARLPAEKVWILNVTSIGLKIIGDRRRLVERETKNNRSKARDNRSFGNTSTICPSIEYITRMNLDTNQRTQ